MPDLAAVIRQEAQDARIDPSALQSFRALRLNQGVADVVSSVLVDAATWRLAMGLPAPWERTREYVLGIDLGQNAAMSAAAAYFRSGELEAVAVFPELPGLGERGLAGGVGRLYLDMQARGYLILWHDGAEVLADALMAPPRARSRRWPVDLFEAAGLGAVTLPAAGTADLQAYGYICSGFVSSQNGSEGVNLCWSWAGTLGGRPLSCCGAGLVAVRHIGGLRPIRGHWCDFGGGRLEKAFMLGLCCNFGGVRVPWDPGSQETAA